MNMLTRQELAEKLLEDFSSAESGEKTKTVVLFGIRYAEALRYVSVAAVVRESGIRKNYVPMVNLGKSLATHVDLRH